MIKNIAVQLSANVAAFRAQMVAAGAAVRDFSGEVSAAAQKNNVAARQAGVALAAIGAAAAAAAALSVKSAMDMERAMQNVATIWDESAQAAAGSTLKLSDATNQLLDLSTELPQSAKTLAEGLYDVASSGFQGTDAMVVLEASAKAASAGLTDTATSARGITAVLNAYGLSAGSATQVSDVLFQTVNLGVVTFEQLANTMGDFIGTAAVAKVDIADANAALATMTLNGISASEAGTSLNRVLQAFIKPSETMTGLLKQMGYESGVVALQSEGLHGIMTKLADTVGRDNPAAWAALFEEIRGLRGALALTGGEGLKYERVFSDMTDTAKVAGATQRALAEQSKSLSFQLTTLKNTVVAAATDFGTALLPIIKVAAAAFQALADAFRGIPAPLQLVIAGGTILAGVVAGLAGAYLLLAPKIAAATALMQGSTVAATVASAAFTALKVSMGVIGLALAVATPLMLAFGRAKGEAARNAKDLAATLDKETQGITRETEALLQQRIVKEGLVDLSKRLNVSLADVADAMLGNEDAAKRVNAALDAQLDAAAGALRAADEQNRGGVGISKAQYEASQAYGDTARAADKLRDKIKDSNKELDKAKDLAKKDAEAHDAAAGAVDRFTGATEESAAALQEQIEEYKNLAEAINGVFDPLAAYQKLATEGGEEVSDSLRDRHDTEKRALDDRLAAQARNAEDEADLRKRRLDDAQRDEKRAWDDRARAEQRALDDRHRQLDRELDAETRRLKDELDEQLALEKDAMDQRTKAIRRAGEDAQEAEDQRYADQKGQLQFLIDTTFGAERQAAIDRMAALDDEHKQRSRAIEDDTDAQVGAEQKAYEKLATSRKAQLDDRLRQMKEGLDEQKRVEKQHLDDTQRDYEQAMDDRQRAQQQALDDELDDLKQANDDYAREQQRALEDRQRAEDAAAETSRRKAKEAAAVKLSDYQAQLDEALRKQELFNTNLAIIAQRGGADVLTEIAKLPPEIVSQLAGAGQPAFDKFVESFRRGASAAKPEDVFGDVGRLLTQIGNFAGKDFMSNVAAGIAGDANAADRLRTILADIMAPREVSPGVYAVPKPGGGYYPIRMTANAEGHVAQIAAAGSMRLWAEPETGGEAYIPLALSKRSRSTSILAQVATQFGYGLVPMANGGMLGATAGRQGDGGWHVSVPVNVEARVAAGVDTDAVGKAIAEQVEVGVRHALDELHREVVVQAWRN